MLSDTGDSLSLRLKQWLDDSGLQFDPFAPDIHNAGDDPRLSTYLVGHDAFATIWGDWISTVLAPAGGGKSAFRVRLAYAARSQEGGRRIFPILHLLPARATTLERHLNSLTRSAAHELLLQIMWRPAWFESLDSETQRAVRRTLDHSLPGWERHFLPQIERVRNLTPLVEEFDRSSARLPNPPDPDRLLDLCAALRAIPADPRQMAAPELWHEWIDLLLNRLKAEAIYILLDGADAYPETIDSPRTALSWLSPLLDQARTWADSGILLKLFLPIEMYDTLWQSHSHLLTFPARLARITWTLDQLAEVLAVRLRIASEGEFDSLDALSTPALHDLNRELASLARPPVPREVLRLAYRIIIEHLGRPDTGDLLNAQDLEAVRHWYRSEQQTAGSP